MTALKEVSVFSLAEANKCVSELDSWYEKWKNIYQTYETDRLPKHITVASFISSAMDAVNNVRKLSALGLVPSRARDMKLYKFAHQMMNGFAEAYAKTGDGVLHLIYESELNLTAFEDVFGPKTGADDDDC